MLVCLYLKQQQSKDEANHYNCVGLYSDQNENAMRRVLNAARSVATNDLKFAIQLGHAGRKASHNVPWLGGRALSKAQDAWLTSAPSSIPFTQIPLYLKN